ncbi:MAG TPA: hypothetical protein PKY01_03030 [Candidatus Hydrogenedentes bacterium]|nr:hypothetical protein [Candidatus Hydrogenedentota bacterium]
MMRQSTSGARERLKKKLDWTDLKLERQLDAIGVGAVDMEWGGKRVQELREEHESANNEPKNLSDANTDAEVYSRPREHLLEPGCAQETLPYPRERGGRALRMLSC